MHERWNVALREATVVQQKRTHLGYFVDMEVACTSLRRGDT